jgi:hypothetical protein
MELYLVHLVQVERAEKVVQAVRVELMVLVQVEHLVLLAKMVLCLVQAEVVVRAVRLD